MGKKKLQTGSGIISSFLYSMFQAKRTLLDYKISQAIKKQLLTTKGQPGVGHLCKQLHLNERDFERRFGCSSGHFSFLFPAKQFSKIIQFQQSLEQLTVKRFTTKLSGYCLLKMVFCRPITFIYTGLQSILPGEKPEKVCTR